MNLRTLLTLGRTSNLPTVWSNVLAGAVASGAAFGPPQLGVLMLCGSAFYVGGMFLNDAFDADVDARERPERPIPAGRASRRAVYALGFGLLAAGLALLAAALVGGVLRQRSAPFVSGLATCAAVLVYNRWHKGHAWAPLVMGACRAGLYVTAALAVSGRLGASVLTSAAALWLYIIGLTHIARFETGKLLERGWIAAFVLSPLVATVPPLLRAPDLLSGLCFLLLFGWTLRAMSFALKGGPGQIPRAVVSLIAGVSLVDALFVSLYGPPFTVLAALGAFLLTLKWQRRIAGT